MLCQMLCHFAHVTQCREIRLQVAASGSGRPAGELPFWPATAPSSGIEAHVTTQFFIVAGDLSLSRLRFVEKLWQLSVVTFWCRLQPEVLLPQVLLLQPQRRMFVTFCFEAVQKFSKRK